LFGVPKGVINWRRECVVKDGKRTVTVLQKRLGTALAEVVAVILSLHYLKAQIPAE
jgi:hypothetical protein